MKFTQEIKDKWLAALRSGEYKKGYGVLYNKEKDTYCCIGVLAKISGMTIDRQPIVSDDYFNETNLSLFPDKIKGKANYNNTVRTLTSLNDIQHKSFIEIADYIEKDIPVED